MNDENENKELGSNSEEQGSEFGQPVSIDGGSAPSYEKPSDISNGDNGKNIYFVGLTGAGKTSIGWGLSKEIGMGFIDLDEWIEEQHEKSIADLFEDEGEAAFRHIEHQAVKQVLAVKNHVISLGGGTVMNDKNWELIRSSGVTVWIQGSPVQVAKRLSNNLEALDQRPMLSRFAEIEDESERYTKVKNEVENMLSVRSKRYGECDFQIDLSHAAVDSSVKQVKELLRASGFFKGKDQTTRIMLKD